ncbi:MAG: DUF4188 domain-containing protein [Nitrososphaerales archaeon]
MRIDKPWVLGRWIPAFAAMPRMLRSLADRPEKGSLGGHAFVYWRSVAMVRYRRSFEEPEGFARGRSEPRVAARCRFDRAVGSDGSVGAWHEACLVQPQPHESVYVNVPRFGLAEATDRVPATGAGRRPRCASEPRANLRALQARDENRGDRESVQEARANPYASRNILFRGCDECTLSSSEWRDNGQTEPQ